MSLRLRPTMLSDLDWVVSVERDGANLPFITPWERPQHEGAIRFPDSRHFIVEEGDALSRIGYVILQGCRNPNGSVELKRLVRAQDADFVVARQRMFIVDADSGVHTVLDADDAGGLVAWLEANGYAPGVAAPIEAVATSTVGPVATQPPSLFANAEPALVVQESSGLHASITFEVGPSASESEQAAVLGDALGTAISLALSSEEALVRSPSFEIAPELFSPSEPVSPAVAEQPSSGADVTESILSEADVAASSHEPARWELAIDAVRRLAQSVEGAQLSPYAEAMAANAVAACLECEVYEVEPDLLQFADDAPLALVELVWAELESELSNSDRAELAVRFAERLSRRRGADGRVALRTQLAGVCRMVLRDPALAYDLLTDHFT
jgi:hypothetical protein